MSSWANGLIPALRPAAEWLLSRHPRLIVSSTYRSYSYQSSLYNYWLAMRRQGYTDEQICARGICTPAPPGRSYHNYGRAFDVNGSASDLQGAAEDWQRIGGRWFSSDPIHFEA